MKTSTYLLTTAILCLLWGCGAPPPPYDLVLQGGHVIDPKNEINEPRDVAIVDGKIAAVEANLPTANAEKVVDVAGLDPGVYYLVVDGTTADAGAYDLTIECGPFADCSGRPAVAVRRRRSWRPLRTRWIVSSD